MTFASESLVPNSSGFVDFNQTYDVTHDEEQRLMEAAMQRAEAADTGAQQQLVRTKQQAVDSGAEGLSQAASYSDYLKAKQQATKAWAAVTASSANPYSDAVRGKVGGKGGLDVAGRASASRDDLAGREANMGRWTEEAFAGKQENDARQAAWAKSQDDAKQRRANEDKENAAAFQTSLTAARGRARGERSLFEPDGYTTPYAGRNFSQMQLAANQRNPGSFDPYSQEGRTLRMDAYGHSASETDNRGLYGRSLFAPNGSAGGQPATNYSTEWEKKYGNYGAK